MKKPINKPGAAVDEMFDGMVAVHPELRRLDDTNVLVRDGAPAEGKVAVVSGGGSSYEPTHVDYLGERMLDGATASKVFISPTVGQLNGMIQATDAGESVFCVVKNYEDDVISFDTAAEMTGTEGVDAKQVVINNDVVVEDSLYTSGHCGVAGTISAHKYAGAKTVAGGDLDEVTVVMEKVVDNVWTMRMAFASCVIPGKGEPTLDPGEDEIELGIGIHGEPGTRHTDVMSAGETTEHLIKNILNGLGPGEGGEVVMMVNGMGGTPLPGLYTVNCKFQSILDDRGVEAWGVWVGDYMTSLDMVGCLASVLRVDDEPKELLDASVETPGLAVVK